ncbi:MAG TPA: primosomal protein N' [Thermoanaerobaculia bacterium]|nr:primosomal protein N' [Thermoanaerobaculia bacterium]
MTGPRERDAAPATASTYVDVAVPVPVHEALTYAVPAGWERMARAGVRVRVPVGKRSLVGVVLRVHRRAPEDFAAREIDRVIDLAPVLDPELLELGAFVADYYLAPIGETLRGFLPAELSPWGSRSVRLTDGGALGVPRSEAERRIRELLLERGELPIADLQRELPEHDVPAAVQALQRDGRLALDAGERTGSRYRLAVELSAGPLVELRERCGRSAKARAVVELLAGLGRPATVREVCADVGCTDTVVRRLVQRGVLRPFTQIERLDLERHRLGEHFGAPPISLRADQETAVESLRAALDARAFGVFFLGGITGSGKTEVYLRALARCVEQGRSGLVLVPEIGLVPALARVLEARFGERLAILHSNLSRAERLQEWERIREGSARVVVGPRSAVFAPLSDLGLVVIDEEHDAAYKQDAVPRYHGRDLALVRARAASATAVLVSATPSLETRLNVERGRYRELRLTRRAGGGELPEGLLVDLRREPFEQRPGEVFFSGALREEIAAAIESGGQVILLRNRRGFSPLLLCRACGEDMRCEDCGLARTYHRRAGRLVCHYCGSTLAAPSRCPRCGEGALEAVGAGTERVEDRFKELFPGVAVEVLDRDATQRAGGVAAILERFQRGDVRALIGTQMVTKGHHFPDVVLTGVLSADTYLGFPDFRAVERTYSLLTQLAGRAGRGERPGRVVIQTHHPDHYAIRAALEHDDRAFAEEELRFRRTFHYPPYTRLVQLLLRDRDRARGEQRMVEIARSLRAHPLGSSVRISGPAPAPLERLRGRYRFQLLLRGPSGTQLRQMIRDCGLHETRDDLVLDVDAQELL